MTKPLKIGLTGGIGVGKSFVANIFKHLGIPIFNSDEYGKRLLLHNELVINKVVGKFGSSILQGNQINRIKLGQIVFNNKTKLEELNQIIHPIIIRQFEDWVTKQNTKYIIKESAILFEAKTDGMLDKIIVISAPEKLRISRVIQRDKKPINEIIKIIKNQKNPKDIERQADFIIYNNETTMLIPQIIKVNTLITQL